MKKVLLAALVLSLVGCGPSEPSNAEIERGIKENFIRRTGAFSAKLDARARKIGNGRWSVVLTAEQFIGLLLKRLTTRSRAKNL